MLLLAGRMQARGSSSYTLRLAEHLPEHGFHGQIVCLSCREITGDHRRNQPICEYPFMGFTLWKWFFSRAATAQFQAWSPRLIHVQTRDCLPVGRWLARTLKAPLVATVHDFLNPRDAFRFPLNQGKVVAVSQAVKTDLVERTKLTDQDVQVVYSGVEIDGEANVASAPRVNHVPVVGTAGPLETVKGQSDFIRAAQCVLGRGLDVEFLIAGSGPEEHNLRRLAETLGVSPHVTFVPYLGEYSDALKAMDVFCLPSLQQGLGTVMFEAMSRGKPVIATRVGGVVDALEDDKTGLIVPPGDPQALAEKILLLLEKPNQARRLAESGRTLIRDRFDVKRMVRETAEIYQQVLDQFQPAQAGASATNA
ncbi:MAG: glycosyltransferase family 4 protein [Planctomycetales bacterium]